jgi:hypothetical protein
MKEHSTQAPQYIDSNQVKSLQSDSEVGQHDGDKKEKGEQGTWRP